MSFNGSGVYTVPTPENPAVANTLIESTKYNTTMVDIATGISTCITKDGQTTVTANIPLAGFSLTNAGIRAPNGTVGAPSITLENDTDCGLYRIGANNVGLSVAGAKVLDISASGLAVTGTLSATSPIGVASGGTGRASVTANSIPYGDGTNALLSHASLTFDGTTFSAPIASVASLTTTSGSVFVNDTTSANMTVGLTVNQGANDNQIFAAKSSDVAHGLTSGFVAAAETDDFLTVQKASSTLGGSLFVSFMEDGAQAVALGICSAGGQADTTDTTGSFWLVNFTIAEHAGANATRALAANANCFAIRGSTGAGTYETRLLLKGDDGELHLGNTTLVALDGEDDVSLVRSMQYVASKGEGMVREPWENEFGTPAWSYDALHRVGVLGERDENGECLFRVQPRFAMNEGAIWQTHKRVRALENQLLMLEQKLAQLEKL